MSNLETHYASLGRIVIYFQGMEAEITYAIQELMDCDIEITQVIVAQLPFQKLCILAQTVFDHRANDVQLKARFAALIKRAMDLERRRNEFLHSTWAGTGDGQVIRIKTAVKLGKGATQASPTVQVSELVNVANEMIEVRKGIKEAWKTAERER
jgi:hypothetical protein